MTAPSPWNRRALEILERLGNQAVVAACCTSLAGLYETLGNPGKATTYRVRAVTIRLEIGEATSGDIQALLKLRHRLGSDRFRASLPPGLDEESVNDLTQMLDQQEESAGDQPDD